MGVKSKSKDQIKLIIHDDDGYQIKRIIHDDDGYYREWVMPKETEKSAPKVAPSPSPSRLLNDFSTRYSRMDHQHTLRFHTIKALKDAILVFSGNLGGGAFAQSMNDINDSFGDMAGVMFATTMMGNSRKRKAAMTSSPMKS